MLVLPRFMQMAVVRHRRWHWHGLQVGFRLTRSRFLNPAAATAVCSVILSKKYKDMFVVSTTDFFYPLVEDPYMQASARLSSPLSLIRLSLFSQGMIACANVVSDMYSMGISDIDNLLMLLAASIDMEPTARDIVTKAMMRGFDGEACMRQSIPALGPCACWLMCVSARCCRAEQAKKAGTVVSVNATSLPSAAHCLTPTLWAHRAANP